MDRVQKIAKSLYLTRKTHHVTQRMATQLYKIYFQKEISQTHICRFEKLQLTETNMIMLCPILEEFNRVLPKLIKNFESEVRKPRKQHKKFVRRPNRSSEEIRREKEAKKMRKLNQVQKRDDHSKNYAIYEPQSPIYSYSSYSEDYNLTSEDEFQNEVVQAMPQTSQIIPNNDYPISDFSPNTSFSEISTEIFDNSPQELSFSTMEIDFHSELADFGLRERDDVGFFGQYQSIHDHNLEFISNYEFL